MRRGVSGTYQSTTVAGETVRAFLPAPLPPAPPIDLDGSVQGALEPALLAMGRLDAISVMLPDTAYFLYSYVRKEAVLSSQIEGTQSSLSELLLFEMAEATLDPSDDVVEVSNYVAAMEHGLMRLRGGFPLSNRLIREIHGVLLRRGRGSDKDPGEFRRSQNWIGGTRPGNAHFVPPPPTEVPGAMGALEKFLHRDDRQSLLIRAGMAHVQFETIHPFLDGNGRVGRLLVTLWLCADGMLREPLLYLSLYLKQHRARYYELLDAVRTTGDWEAWLVFFLEGIKETAEGAVNTAQRLVALHAEDRATLQPLGRRAVSAIRVLEMLRSRPVTSVRFASKQTGLTFPTVNVALELLLEQGIVHELTGRRRDRLFGYHRYLKILSEGTEQL